MLITIHTDNHIQGREDVAQSVESRVADAVGGFSEWITRIEVHLSDENANKRGDSDKRCLMDVHPKGAQHLAVHHNAETVREAVDGACDKLVKILDKFHSKRLDRHQKVETPPVYPETVNE